MGYRVGVDIGGTFTDFCVFDENTGSVSSLKVLSTPATPGREVLAGLALCQSRYGIDPARITYFTHGQTVGINTVLQRTGARLALFVTENFREVLELERLRIADTFNIRATRPEPLITRERVIGIRERLRSDGAIQLPLDPDSVTEAVKRARALGVDGIVVAFLNAHRNSAHEAAAATQIVAVAPDLFVFKSSEVWPIIREYERTITAVLNAYVHPKVDGYLSSLQRSLASAGVPISPLVTKSNGGVMSAERGKSACVQIMLSGTASGVIGASQIARLSGAKNVLSLDIGGTSADLSLIIDAKPQFGVGERVGDFRVFVPSIAVSSIGAGGGSVAWLNSLGVLKVGPRSAGADPGPACFGRGAEPTVTDAFVACGFIGEDSLGYGAVAVDVERAARSMAPIAEALELSVLETAEAIIRVKLSEMYLETSKVLARFGADPREFTLLPFGGAGPMMAGFLAKELGICHIVVPPAPGVLSALGGLFCDVRNDFISTVYLALNDDRSLPILRKTFTRLASEAATWLVEEGGYTGEAHYSLSADMRYRGQSFEIEVALGSDVSEMIDAASIAAQFHTRHQSLYDHADETGAVEIVNARVSVSAPSPKPELLTIANAVGPPIVAAFRDIRLDGRAHSAPIYDRAALAAGHELAGPCVVVQSDSTTCVPDGFRCQVDAYGLLHLHANRSDRHEAR